MNLHEHDFKIDAQFVASRENCLLLKMTNQNLEIWHGHVAKYHRTFYLTNI